VNGTGGATPTAAAEVTGQATPAAAVSRAFGEHNRARLLEEHFAAQPAVAAATAWTHIYRLLLWVDRTTGLAHCYESDKCQPGRPWYARSLAFHDWVSGALGLAPGELGEQVDILFRRATADLAAAATARRSHLAAETAAQRQPYTGRGLPEPGEDPELEAIITDGLAPYLAASPPPAALRALTERIQAHVGQENKRKNLVGEGFEDTVAALLRRIPGITDHYDIRVRPVLHDLPGFRPPRAGSKTRQVDVSLVQRSTGHRTLVSCKWSVRSDREEQFASDFRDYAELEDAGQDFGYVLVTNEFDPARLAAACDMRRQNAPLFTAVVHVNPDGPRAAYAPAGATGRTHAARSRPATSRDGASRALAHIDSGRLAPFSAWAGTLATP